MKKVTLLLSFLFIFTMLVQAQNNDLQGYVAQLQKLHKALMAKHGVLQYFEDAKWSIKPAPVKRVVNQVMSVAFAWPYISVCFKYLDKDNNEQVLFRYRKFHFENDVMTMEVVTRFIKGDQTKTLAYTHTISSSGERAVNEIKLNTELSDRTDWMCWLKCGWKCGMAAYEAYKQCHTDWQCWMNNFGSLWNCVQQNCLSCF